jgi:hypothetical protein
MIPGRITALERAAVINDRPVLLSERMLLKDYESKYSGEKKKNLPVMILKGLGAKTN